MEPFETIQVFTRDRSGTGPVRIQTDPKLDLHNSRSSFGSVPDRFQNDPVETEGPIFGPDPFVSKISPVLSVEKCLWLEHEQKEKNNLSEMKKETINHSFLQKCSLLF